MSKITFRAEDDLVERVERLDASKSEVMREALRAYLDEHEPARGGRESQEATLDELVAERVDAMLAERTTTGGGQDLDLTISLEGVEGAGRVGRSAASDAADVEAPASDAGTHACGQCGTDLADDHVYCPNCGEKASRRVFCDCGDELRSDWAFCPGCGRRTPAADVLDGG
jgi:Arc/MetJ-type ribon-helix-helix transcriptional regulator